MSDTHRGDDFTGYDHNRYQEYLHTLAHISLWSIIIIGVACGVFGIIWGATH